jgi:hypothetical protein
MGSVATALLVAFAIEERPLESWGVSVLKEGLQLVRVHLLRAGRDLEEYDQGLDYFVEKWEKYLKLRNLVPKKAKEKELEEDIYDFECDEVKYFEKLNSKEKNNKKKDGKTEEKEEEVPKFPKEYGVEERDKFYTTLSFSGWAGSSGHDAPLIAYGKFLFPLLCTSSPVSLLYLHSDALLRARENWEELVSCGGFLLSSSLLSSLSLSALSSVSSFPLSSASYVQPFLFISPLSTS